MSLILEALKKLEREKSLSRGGEMNIATGILRPEPARKERKIFLILLAAVLISVCVAGTTYIVLAGAGQPAPSPPVPKPQDPQPQAVPIQVGGTSSPAKAIPARPASPDPTVRNPLPPGAPTGKTAEAKERALRPAAGNGSAGESSRDNPGDRPRVEKKEDDPVLKVSGIVWFEEREARRAFVNNVPLREGDTIEGTRIERIDPNLVRFTRNGKTFDVKIY